LFYDRLSLAAQKLREITVPMRGGAKVCSEARRGKRVISA